MARTMVARAVGLVIVMAGPAAAQPEPPKPEPEPAPDTGRPPDPAPDPTVPVEAPQPAPALDDADAAPAGFTWHAFGYLRVQAALVQNDPNVAFVGRSDGFELQNARIGARGELGDRASFVVSFDGAVDEREHINDPNGRLRVGLRDAFTDLHFPTGVDLRVGRFDVVFDPERLVPDTERAFVDRALESRGVRPTEGWEASGLPPGRSIGVAVRKDPGVPTHGFGLGFELAAQNGADEFSSDNDNDLPAVSAAAVIGAPSAVLLAAARWNARTEGDLPFRQDETDLEGAVGALITAGPVRIGAGAIFVRTIFDTTGGPAQNAYGGHAQAMVRVVGGAHPIQVGYRFAIMDPSDLILTDRIMEHTAGAVIAWPAWRLRGQLNVTHVMEQAARDLSNGRVEAALEVQL